MADWVEGRGDEQGAEEKRAVFLDGESEGGMTQQFAGQRGSVNTQAHMHTHTHTPRRFHY